MQEVVGSIPGLEGVRKGKTNQNGKQDKIDRGCIAPRQGEASSLAHQAIAAHLRLKEVEGGNSLAHLRAWAAQEGNIHRDLEEAFHSTVWMGRRLDPVGIHLVAGPYRLKLP